MDAGYIFTVVFHLSLDLPLIFRSPFNDSTFVGFLDSARQMFVSGGFSLNYVGYPASP